MVWWIIQEFRLRNRILEIFLTLWNFQSWNVNFRTEVCLRTVDPQITTLWSKEVDIAKINWRTYDLAIDHGERFSWLRYAWCGDCVSLEEASQHAVKFPKKSKCRRAACSKTGPILTTKTDCVHDLRVFLCNQRLWSSTMTLNFVHYKYTKMTMFKISTSDAMLLYYLWVKCPQIRSWKDCTSQKSQNSVQLQTVLALYDQETARSKEPNNQQSKTAVKLHFDLMMWTRNFRVRNDVAENESVTKRQKRKKA